MSLLVLLAPTSGGAVTLLYAYNFDEASGNILDQSGNGRDTVFGGSLSRSASGHTSKGLTQTSAAADSAGPSLTGLQTAQFTMMFWFFRTSNSQVGWVGQLKDAGSGDRGFLFISGNVRGRARNSGGTAGEVIAAEPSINNWHHGAVTYDGSKVHLFLDGVESGTGSPLAAPLKTTSTSSHLLDTLGTETIIDDLRYYDTALDAATITTLMGTPVTGGGTTPVTATRATTWRVAATVSGTRATTWRVRAAVSSTRATTWRVRAQVAGARATTWRVLSAVTATRATTWAVASTLTTVTATRATTWKVAARVTATRVVVWDTRTVVTSSRVATWDVLARLTATRATTWRVLTRVAPTRATTWRVLARPTASRSTTWAVEVIVVPYTPPDEVTATPRSHASTASAREPQLWTATARDPEPMTTARAYSSTATARSPE